MTNEDTTRPRRTLRVGATRAMSALRARVGRLSSAIMIKATLIGVVGICMLVWPIASLRFLILAIAALLIADGIAGVFGSLQANQRRGYLGQSILSLVVGAILLFWPDVTMRLLMRLMGVWGFLHGAALLWSLREMPNDEAFRSPQRAVAIVVAAIGAVLLYLPNVGAVTLSWAVGIAALLIAAALFWLVRRMKGLGRHMAAGAA